MAAMANVEYYKEGLVDIPIPYVKECKHFFEAKPDPRFVYPGDNFKPSPL